MADDGRTTIRIDKATMRRVKRMATTTGRTINAMIGSLLMDATGYIGTFPCILTTGEDYIWVSPAGYFGPVNKTICKRFVHSGGVPISGESWTEAFDTMAEACEQIATRMVCRQSSNGLVISSYDDFINMINKFMA